MQLLSQEVQTFLKILMHFAKLQIWQELQFQRPIVETLVVL